VTDEPEYPDPLALKVAHTEDRIDGRLHQIGRVPVPDPDRADPVVSEVMRQTRVEIPCRGVKPAAGPAHQDETGACRLRCVVAAGGRPPVGLYLHDVIGLADLRHPSHVREMHLDLRHIYFDCRRPEHGVK